MGCILVVACADPCMAKVATLIHAHLCNLLGGATACGLCPLSGRWLDYSGSTHFTPHRDTEEDRDLDFLNVDSQGERVFGWCRMEWTTVVLLHGAHHSSPSSMRVLGYDPVEYLAVGDCKVFPSCMVHETTHGSKGDRKLAIFWGRWGAKGSPVPL